MIRNRKYIKSLENILHMVLKLHHKILNIYYKIIDMTSTFQNVKLKSTNKLKFHAPQKEISKIFKKKYSFIQLMNGRKWE